MLADELTELLQVRYPRLYSRSAGVLREYGIECEDGWFDIIDELSAKLEAELVALSESGAADSELPRPTEIKNVNGTLRVCMDRPTASMRAAIEAALQESASTCELCGNLGMLRQGSLLRVRCDECEAHRNLRWSK